MWQPCHSVEPPSHVQETSGYNSTNLTVTRDILTISGGVNRASATETVDSGSITSRVKAKLQKLVFTASLRDVQH